MLEQNDILLQHNGIYWNKVFGALRKFNVSTYNYTITYTYETSLVIYITLTEITFLVLNQFEMLFRP